MKKYRLLHQEISVAPFTMGIVHRGFHNKLHLKYTKPLYFKNSVTVYKGTSADWYGDHENFRDLGYKIIDNAKKNIKFRDILLKETLEIGQDLFKENKKINKLDLSKLTNTKLAKVMNKIYSLGNDLCDVGMIAAAPDVAFSNFSILLKKVIDKKINKYSLKRTSSEYFNILTNYGKGSLIAQEDLAISKLALEINKQTALKKLFKNEKLKKIIDVLSNQYLVIYKKIIKIKKDYEWFTFGQLGPAKSLEEYVKDIKNLFVKETTYKKINLLNQEWKLLKQKQVKCFKELKLNKEEIELFKTAQNFSYNKAFRYDMLLYTYYTLDKLLREISKRINISVKEMRFCSPQEITKFLQGNKPVNRNELKKRQSLCVAVIKGRGMMHLTNKKAKEYIKKNLQEPKIKKDITIIHGTTAYLGRITGTVKIVNDMTDLKKVKKGDILVAIQTTPDLVPAMKLAAAFVTDIGGITSHAAIVAREMKKPCIIGTKFASKVLKDGDLVEVNANEGDVQKIK